MKLISKETTVFTNSRSNELEFEDPGEFCRDPVLRSPLGLSVAATHKASVPFLHLALNVPANSQGMRCHRNNTPINI